MKARAPTISSWNRPMSTGRSASRKRPGSLHPRLVRPPRASAESGYSCRVYMPVFARLVLMSAIAVGAGACKTASGGSSTGTRIVQPGAPGQANKTINTEQATDLSKVGHTAADVKFMQGMIGHHAQAVEMVALINERTQNQDLKMLGLRIQVSQDDEMDMMRKWLQARGEQVPGPHAHHEPGGF